MKLGTTCRNITFSDVTNGYLYVLFGFFAHLYIIFSSSIYFALEHEITHHLGITKETLINYFAVFSIIILLISRSLKWTWPIFIEDALIVLCIWILLRNLIPKECLCCSAPILIIHSTMANVTDGAAPTPNPMPPNTTINSNEDIPPDRGKKRDFIEEEDEESEHCPWHNFNIIYSVLCVIVMLSSFMMLARNYFISMFFTILAIVLMIFTSLVPVSCNQLNAVNANTNLIKFTFYSMIWFLNRRKHLSEQCLCAQYFKSFRILYSYEDCRQKHLLCGVKHTKNSNKYRTKKKYTTTTLRHTEDVCDDISCFIEGDQDCLIPRPLFDNLEELCKVVLNHRARCEKAAATAISNNNINTEHDHNVRHFAWQLHQIIKIQQINRSYNERRWFGNFFSWKHRFYDTDILHLFDLTKTIWILNVCPIFLLFVPLEYFLMTSHTSWNIQELQCLIERVKVMSHIRFRSHQQQQH